MPRQAPIDGRLMLGAIPKCDGSAFLEAVTAPLFAAVMAALVFDDY
jgi:hypothetical protein